MDEKPSDGGVVSSRLENELRDPEHLVRDVRSSCASREDHEYLILQQVAAVLEPRVDYECSDSEENKKRPPRFAIVHVPSRQSSGDRVANESTGTHSSEDQGGGGSWRWQYWSLETNADLPKNERECAGGILAAEAEFGEKCARVLNNLWGRVEGVNEGRERYAYGTLEELVPYLRSVFSGVLGGTSILPPRGVQGKEDQETTGKRYEMFLITVQDFGDRARFTFFVDREWADAVRKAPDHYGVSSELEFMALALSASWQSNPEEGENEWVSSRAHRLKVPLLQVYSPPSEEEKGTPGLIAAFERTFFPEKSTVLHIPVLQRGRVVAIVGLLIREGAERQPPVPKLTQAIARMTPLFHVALGAARETVSREDIWFFRHNFPTTYMAPFRGSMEEATVLADRLADRLRDPEIEELKGHLDRAWLLFGELEAGITTVLGELERDADKREREEAELDLYAATWRFMEQVLLQLVYQLVGKQEWRRKIKIVLDGIPSREEVEGGLRTYVRGTDPVFRMAMSTIVGNAIRSLVTPVNLNGQTWTAIQNKEACNIQFRVRECANEKSNGNKKLRLTVVDDGCGIAPARLELLRSMLATQQLPYSVALGRLVTGWGGAGIGLYSARRVLARFGAQLQIDESRFSPELPPSSRDLPYSRGGSGTSVSIEWEPIEVRQ